MISGLYYDSQKGPEDIMSHIYQKRVALNIMTMFCYETRFSSVTDPMLHQILSDASTISRYLTAVVSVSCDVHYADNIQFPFHELKSTGLYPALEIYI